MDGRADAGWRPAAPRQRAVSKALQAYALMATSAATGAVRDLAQWQRR
jgi:dihydroxy-acid dehydratase